MGYGHCLCICHPTKLLKLQQLPNLLTSANAIGGWLSAPVRNDPHGTCLFAHDADFKGRADLVPNCNLPQDTQGHCSRPHCFYN